MTTNSNVRTAVTLLILTLLSLPLGLAAQSITSNSTPTPAPTKTLDLSPTTASSTAEPGLSINPLARAFTQADLSVLTGNIQRPNGLFWYDSKVYTSCSGDWTLYEIDAETGSTAQYIYGVRNAHTLLAMSNNGRLELWVPDFQANTLVQISNGVIRIVATDLPGPWGITQLNDEHVVVTNLQSDTVVAVNDEGQVRELIRDLRSPAGIAVDVDYLYVANTGSARRAIEWFNIETITSTTESRSSEDTTIAFPLLTGVQNVTNITMGVDGNLYFGYALGTRGVVGRINPAICRRDGGCSSADVEIVVYSELAAPLAGITISSDMRLYLHSIFSPDIYWVDVASD